jgi:hypothetical protein
METIELGDGWFLAYGLLALLIVGAMVWQIIRKKGSPFS